MNVKKGQQKTEQESVWDVRRISEIGVSKTPSHGEGKQ
jgi:hypothetical protein